MPRHSGQRCAVRFKEPWLACSKCGPAKVSAWRKTCVVGWPPCAAPWPASPAARRGSCSATASNSKNAGLDLAQVEEDRINKELIIFADRSDISEELTRLLSHFQQFDDYVKTREAVGRTLDFLAQEINREINTIGAKANDALIAREVVFLKTELEKFREQVQNIE
jgi:hypothetical protein